MEASIQTPEFVLLLSSINDKLASLLDLVETKKKKSDIKKEENSVNKEKKKLYTKKKDGTVIFNEKSVKELDSNRQYFYNSLALEFPNICLMESTLTFEQYQSLVDRFTRPLVKDMMLHLDNYGKIYNYVSAYKVLYRWLLRDERHPRN